MKKNRIGLMALAALMTGGISQAAPITVESPVPVTQQAKQTLPKRTRENRREILPDGIGGIRIPYIDHGTSPKEYGQWLQGTGKQKWIKSKK
jgi:hypothetical protein